MAWVWLATVHSLLSLYITFTQKQPQNELNYIILFNFQLISSHFNNNNKSDKITFFIHFGREHQIQSHGQSNIRLSWTYIMMAQKEQRLPVASNIVPGRRWQQNDNLPKKKKTPLTLSIKCKSGSLTPTWQISDPTSFMSYPSSNRNGNP